MSLSDLASIGSFVSGVAVVVSFAFLALQMRQTNANQKSLMQQGRSARTVDMLMKMSEPGLSETIINAFDGGPGERARVFAFYSFACACFWNYEDSFLQFRAKRLDARGWATDELTLRGLLGNPAYRAVWRMARAGMNADYRDYLDRLMRDVQPSEPRDVAEVWRAYFNEERGAPTLGSA
ncbi:MAG TPA: hypothetical protein VMT68_17830 [Caulobacteraceae bacterium]|nr:hypothetical protein [Caulobacteraceae bacterium]